MLPECEACPVSPDIAINPLVIGAGIFHMLLPVLKFTSALYPQVDLSGTLIIACQHVLETTFDMFQELFEKGLKPQNVFLLGKCYSTNTETLVRFRERGVHISPLSTAFVSHMSFDSQFRSYVRSFLLDADRRAPRLALRNIVILDDGGELIRSVNADPFLAGDVVAIEQTSSGYNAIHGLPLRFPVINVARSRAKLSVEPPFVAMAISERIETHFRARHSSPKRILILGRGPMGKALADCLSQRHDVTTYDVAVRHVPHPSFCGFDTIVGATGQAAVGVGDYAELMRGVTLISASSSDREFSAVSLRRRLPKTHDCHQTVSFGGITLLNSGFPINFDGREHSVRPEHIQFTRSLIFAAICGAVTAPPNPGLADLDHWVQEQIMTEFQRISQGAGAPADISPLAA